MISPRALGELKEGAAGLVALAELLSSRRVGPKAIAAALPPASEACAGVLAAASALEPEVILAARADLEASGEIRATYERAARRVKELEAELRTGSSAPAEARTRLVLERAAHAASAHVAAALFIAEMFAAAASPRPIAIRVADVLGFSPALADGPQVVRATLDAQPGPVATIDARLLRALVELGVQIVAAAGVDHPHVKVSSGAAGGATVLIGARSAPPPPVARRLPKADWSEVAAFTVRRLPWSPEAVSLARAAAATAGAAVTVEAAGRGLALTFS